MTTNPADSDDRIPHESNEEDVHDQDAEPTSTAPTEENLTVPPGSTS
jgi:hypothetical protein